MRSMSAPFDSWDKHHILHPWADMRTVGAESPLVISRAEGVWVFDRAGHRYLDAIGGMWCMTLGHGCIELAKVMHEQALKMPYYTPFGSMANEPASALAARLAELAPGDLTRVHFTTCGSTAVESALRFAHYYFGATGRPKKKHIVSRVDAYHGSTYLAASISGKAWDRTCFHYENQFVHLLSSPHPRYRESDESEAQFCERLTTEFEQLIKRIGADNIACFIAEPILASGGVIIPPEGYQRKMFDTCRRNGILYISDEVVTGFGRLGHFFASEPRFDVVPDLLITAKGLTSGYQPLGAVLISERLIAEITGESAPARSTFSNGFTYSAHPVASAVALANIDVMERDDVCGHVRDVGPYFIERLNELRHFSIVADIRGDHLMACIECGHNREPDGTPALEDIDKAQRVDAICQDNGLLVRPYENMCILSPPLIITREEIDEIVRILALAVEEVSC